MGREVKYVVRLSSQERELLEALVKTGKGAEGKTGTYIILMHY
jgi:hypothetical protein